MPFCRDCGTEYAVGAAKCQDCGAELTDEAPPTQFRLDRKETRPVELCVMSDMVQLDLLETQLRSASIPTARRPQTVALYVQTWQLEEAQRLMQGKTIVQPRETVGLSELNRIRLACEACEKVTTVDLLEESAPSACSCGHYSDLAAVRPVLDRYRDVIRTMADADFEIELVQPEAEPEG